MRFYVTIDVYINIIPKNRLETLHGSSLFIVTNIGINLMKKNIPQCAKLLSYIIAQVIKFLNTANGSNVATKTEPIRLAGKYVHIIMGVWL